jgi:hypothetical protein
MLRRLVDPVIVEARSCPDRKPDSDESRFRLDCLVENISVFKEHRSRAVKNELVRFVPPNNEGVGRRRSEEDRFPTRFFGLEFGTSRDVDSGFDVGPLSDERHASVEGRNVDSVERHFVESEIEWKVDFDVGRFI